MVQKSQFFLFLDLVKIRLEIRFNKVLDRKQTGFYYKEKNFQSSKNRILSKGLTHAFGQNIYFFSLFVFGQKVQEMGLNDVLERKQTFFDY